MAQMVKRQRKGSGSRPALSYRVRWRLNGTRDGAWQSVTFRDRETAKTFKALVEARGHRLRADAPEVRDLSILTGVRVADGAQTLRSVAERYIATRTTTKATTRERYQRLLDRHLAAWHDRPIETITSDDVALLINDIRERGLNPVSAYDFAKMVFRYATNTEPPLRVGNPCASVKVPRTRERTLTFLTGEEAKILLDSCGEVERPLVEVMLNTGLRFGEVTALRVRDLDLGQEGHAHRRAGGATTRGWTAHAHRQAQERQAAPGPSRSTRRRPSFSAPTPRASARMTSCSPTRRRVTSGGTRCGASGTGTRHSTGLRPQG